MNQAESLTDGPLLRQIVLVVDDDPQIRQSLRWALEDEGIEVETAADGREALNQAAQHRPALLVLDMGMPVLDGDGVVSALRQAEAPLPPILLITADGRAAEKAG